MLGFEDFKKLRGDDFASLSKANRRDLKRLYDEKPDEYQKLDSHFRQEFEEWWQEVRRDFVEKGLFWMEVGGLDNPRGSDNPFHAWATWKHARHHHLRPPDWVFRYFDQSADSVLALVDEKPERFGVALQKALGFTPDRHPSYLAEYRTVHEHFELALSVAKCRRETGKKMTPAIEEVAFKSSSDAKIVKSAYVRFKGLLEWLRAEDLW